MSRRQVFIVVAFAAGLAARGDDWQMFGRDSSHNAVSKERGAPTDWQNAVPASKDAPAKAARNIRWSAKLGTRSMGGPIVAGGLIWVGTNNASPRDPRDTRPRKDGKREPVDMRKEFGVVPYADLMAAGFAPSPAADAERVFSGTSNGMDESHTKIPAPDAPSLVSFNKRTGATVWMDASPGKGIMHSQRSSPLLVEVGGRTLVVAGQGDGWLRAFDAATGKPVWWCDLNPKGARYELGGHSRRNYVMATPVACDGRIYVGTGQSPEHWAGEGNLHCIGPGGAGDVSAELDDGAGPTQPNPSSKVVWRFGGPVPKQEDARGYRFGRTLANCVVHGGLVYACDFEGSVYCLDAATGRPAWQHDTRSSCWCGPLWADGKVFVPTEDGDVWVFAHGREKRILSTVEMNEQIHVTPVYANGTLYVATASHLVAIQAPK